MLVSFTFVANGGQRSNELLAQLSVQLGALYHYSTDQRFSGYLGMAFSLFGFRHSAFSLG
jgi:hypothetical protein